MPRINAHELLNELDIPKVGNKASRVAFAISHFHKSNQWREKRLIACYLGIIAHADNKDPTHWFTEAARCQLNSYESIPSWHEHLFINGHPSCGMACAQMDGRRYTLERARKEMPIPNPKCTNNKNKAGFGECACDWMVDLTRTEI
jgi:hypothetical protein